PPLRSYALPGDAVDRETSVEPEVADPGQDPEAVNTPQDPPDPASTPEGSIEATEPPGTDDAEAAHAPEPDPDVTDAPDNGSNGDVVAASESGGLQLIARTGAALPVLAAAIAAAVAM